LRLQAIGVAFLWQKKGAIAMLKKSAIIPDMPFDQYHGDAAFHAGLGAIPSISSSGIRTIITKSPAHYWDTSYLNPDRENGKTTDAMTLGRAVHWLVMSEDSFAKNFAVKPAELNGKPWHGSRKECREWLKEAEENGKEIITEDMINAVMGMKRSLEHDPLVKQGVLSGESEVSFLWLHDDVVLKSRPDLVNKETRTIIDLKSTRDASKPGCARAIREYRYDIQIAMARWAVVETLGIEIKAEDCLLCFVENVRPYCVTWVQFSEQRLASCMDECKKAIETFRECLALNDWPGYTDGTPIVLKENEAKFAA
jgi:hypothetical protein